MDKSTKNFIREHANDDVIQLRLQAKRYPAVDMNWAVRQIAGLQKIKHKVPLFYESGDIWFPGQLSIEQSSSEITARYKSGLFSGRIFADMTGGFGVDFYFFSLHFQSCIYVEQDAELCELAAHNLDHLGVSAFEIHRAKSEDFVKTMPEVDLIYIDPHRRSKTGKKTVLISDCEPDVSVLADGMLRKSPLVLIKLSPVLDIHRAVGDLPQTAEVHVLAVDNECKEILLVLKRKIESAAPDTATDKILIKTRNLFESGKSQAFDFTFEEEKQANPIYTEATGCYLYEPNAAIMKSGAFKSIAIRFNLKKFHVNTHLYTGDELLPDFPGRIMQVSEVFGHSKSALKQLKARYPQANISVRNYPISVDDFRKKTGIKEGGKDYLFVLKSFSEKHIIVACKKVGGSFSKSEI